MSKSKNLVACPTASPVHGFDQPGFMSPSGISQQARDQNDAAHATLCSNTLPRPMSKSKNLVADLRADLEGMAVKLEMALADERRCEDQARAAKRAFQRAAKRSAQCRRMKDRMAKVVTDAWHIAGNSFDIPDSAWVIVACFLHDIDALLTLRLVCKHLVGWTSSFSFVPAVHVLVMVRGPVEMPVRGPVEMAAHELVSEASTQERGWTCWTGNTHPLYMLCALQAAQMP